MHSEPRVIPQLLGTIGACLTSVYMGASFAIASPMVYAFENGLDGAGMKMTTEEASWIRT